MVLQSLTYCGLCNPSHRHSEAQQGVVLILRQSQQLGDVLERLGWGIPVQSRYGLTKRHNEWSHRSTKLLYIYYNCKSLYFNNIMNGWLKSVKAAGWAPSWWQGWLTQGKCSTVPLCGGCEVLQALCCGGGAGGCCQHELCSGQSSLLPAGPGSTSYTSPCKQNRGVFFCRGTLHSFRRNPVKRSAKGNYYIGYQM